MPVVSVFQRITRIFTILGRFKPNSHPSNPFQGSSKHLASSGVHSAGRPTDANERGVPPPINSCEGTPVAAATSRDAATGVKNANTGKSQDYFNRHATFKPSSTSASINVGEGEQRGHEKTYALLGPCGKREALKIEPLNPIEGSGMRQQSICDSATSRNADSSRLRTTHHEAGSKSTSVLLPGGGQQESAETKATESRSTESRELESLRQELAELKERFEARPKDQVVSCGFVELADTSSDTDVIRALQRLNAEIQQHATYMADCLVQAFEFKNANTDVTKEQVSLMQRVLGHIGQVSAKALGSRPQDVPLLLQIAFQAHLTGTLGQTASAWTLDQKQNTFIDRIYRTLRGEEAQATSGRWRSLARHHNLYDGLDDPEPLVDTLILDLSNIMLVAGCNAAQSDIRSTITSKFKERIALLVELAVRLNKIFDEVVSSDFEVFLVKPGDKFESNDMEETDGDQADGSLVLCTTHLGLIKQVPEGTLWEKGKKQKKMVLKPKVLLESLLDTED